MVLFPFSFWKSSFTAGIFLSFSLYFLHLLQIVGITKILLREYFSRKSINPIGILSVYFTVVYPWISFSHFCKIMQILLLIPAESESTLLYPLLSSVDFSFLFRNFTETFVLMLFCVAAGGVAGRVRGRYAAEWGGHRHRDPRQLSQDIRLLIHLLHQCCFILIN